MARTIGSSFSTQLSSGRTRPFYAIEFLYPQALRAWTGYGEFTISGQIYTGLGNLINIRLINFFKWIRWIGCCISITRNSARRSSQFKIWITRNYSKCLGNC